MEEHWDRFDDNERDSLKSSVNSIKKRTFRNKIVSRDESFNHNLTISQEGTHLQISPEDEEVYATYEVYFHLKKSLLLIWCELENLELAKTIIEHIIAGIEHKNDTLSQYLK